MSVKTWRNMTAEENAEKSLPVLVSPAFQKLIDEAQPQAAEVLKKQVIPEKAENEYRPHETADPLGESRYCVTPFLVHQYKNRVLLLTTGKCLSYCRYCFRRGFTARGSDFITDSQIKTVTDYIKTTPSVKEILVSGGDPLTGSFDRLSVLISALRESSAGLIIRICTRAPVFAPELFTGKLVSLFKKAAPLWLIPHINHPAELGTEQKKAILKCINTGIPVQSQTVLLKNVNDNAETLVELFNMLTCMGVKPGYLFQLDLAYGTQHFRVPLTKALQLWEVLKTELSGLSLPQFAVDLPDGGGKFPLSALALHNKIIETDSPDSFSAIGFDGKVYKYIS